jgi:Mechanosensitive ion channel, conserved TM helix
MQTIPVAVSQSNPFQAVPPVYVDNATIWRHMSEALHQSLYRVLSLLIAFLPGILAFFVALLIFTLIGMVLSALLRRGLTAAKFDDRIARNHPDPGWAPSTSPTTLVGRAAFWGCLLLGLLIGVSAFDTSFAAAATLPISLLPYLTHAVGAIFLLIAGNLIARFLARSVLIGAVNAQLQYARFLSLGVKWLVLVLTAAMVLEHLEIGGVVVDLAFGILFGGIVLTLALAVGLGSRELVSRSLESHVERSGERGAEPTAASPDESIRHF